MSDSNEIRRANIERNHAFMREIGLGNSTLLQSEITSSVQNDQPANRKRTIVATGESADASNSRRSSRLLENTNKEKVSKYKCDSCNKYFDSNRGLNVHVVRKRCVGNANYMPAWYVDLHESEIQQMFSSQNSGAEQSSSNTTQEHEITQTIFEEERDVTGVTLYDHSDQMSEEPDMDLEQPELDLFRDVEALPIETFSDLQIKLCSKLYGDDYINCQSYDDMILAIQQHYNGHHMQRALKEQAVFNFCSEFGLSRTAGDKLLALIREFRPAIPVSRSLRNSDKRIKKDVSAFNKITKINIPWIKDWKMNELKHLPSVNIYVRNIFEVISHMLIDPELMFVWQNHIRWRYNRALDLGDRHVFSDIMTSNWALESEKMVVMKDSDGFLMPIIFYTDGVQVSSSVHNKITPVVISLGNFSDTLLQKDISKRVIAYLPNFKCYSKDMMVSHLMTKLKISCNKVKQNL